MLEFEKLITNEKFTLVASLPDNRIDFARAAIEGGVQAIKVHLNLLHRASGNGFGNFQSNKSFLKELIELAGDIPVGVVPGASESFITKEELLELEDLGVKFFSAYAQHLPPFMMTTKKLTKMVAIDNSYNNITVEAVRNSSIDILEASIIPGEAYGSSLNYLDILSYSHLVKETKKPVLIPTQKHIRPQEVKYLYEAGCKAVMIGAVVTGGDSAEKIKQAATAFREAIEIL